MLVNGDCSANCGRHNFGRERARKRRYFSIARGSVIECGALFDLFNALGNLSPDEYRAGKLLLTRIGAMLCKLCLLGRVTTLFRVRSRLRARACSRPETPILPTRFHEEPEEFW
jgi:hypothetical protein